MINKFFNKERILNFSFGCRDARERRKKGSGTGQCTEGRWDCGKRTNKEQENPEIKNKWQGPAF